MSDKDKRCTVTVTKKFTLKTGNYSSISPSVSVSINNVKPLDMGDAHRQLEIVADGLLHDQIESDAKTMATIKKLGFSEYFKNIDREKLDESVEQALGELNGLEDPPF